jgi:hypothetical protein
MDSLQRFLVDYDMAMLRALALGRGARLATNRQAEAVGELVAILSDPLSVRVALAELSEEGSTALEAIMSAGGQMRAATFTRRFGEVRPIGPGRLERERPWQNPASPAEELLYAGLIFRAFHSDRRGPGEFYLVPDELVGLLPFPQGTPAAFVVEPVPAPLHPVDGGPALVRDMFAYLVFLQAREVRPYADGRLGRADRAALEQQLTGTLGRRLTFLRRLALRLGFVVRGEEFLGLDAGSVKRWLTDGPSRQLAALQEAWRDDPEWDDLCRVPGLECDDKAPWRLRRELAGTREAILALLAQCPAGEWWIGASFVAAVKAADPDFQRPDGDYSSWYIRDRASGEYLTGFESWDQVEGELVADLLTGPLSWLGVVATGEAGSQSACMVTESGARLLGLAAGEERAWDAAPIRVGSDFGVQVPQPANLYARFQLERFADLEREAPCRYRLGATSLARALAHGIRVSQVLAFLEQANRRPVPPNVVGQLRLWAGRFDQLDLVEGALITVRHERVLKELSVLPETRGLIHEMLSPTSAMVHRKDLARLRKALRDLGYLGAEEP